KLRMRGSPCEADAAFQHRASERRRAPDARRSRGDRAEPGKPTADQGSRSFIEAPRARSSENTRKNRAIYSSVLRKQGWEERVPYTKKNNGSPGTGARAPVTPRGPPCTAPGSPGRRGGRRRIGRARHGSRMES